MDEIDGFAVSAREWMTVMLPLLEEGHTLKLRPSGTSMHPFLHGDRDEVFLKSAAGAELRRGDIALYCREDGIHVLHRVHHVDGDRLYMLGDHQTWIEGPVPREAVKAVASSYTRAGRGIDCANLGYRALSELWLRARPMRPLLFKMRAGLEKLRRK